MTLGIVDTLVAQCGIRRDDEEAKRPIDSVDNVAVIPIDRRASVAPRAAITQKLTWLLTWLSTWLPPFCRDMDIRRPVLSGAQGTDLESRERLGHS